MVFYYFLLAYKINFYRLEVLSQFEPTCITRGMKRAVFLEKLADEKVFFSLFILYIGLGVVQFRSEYVRLMARAQCGVKKRKLLLSF